MIFMNIIVNIILAIGKYFKKRFGYNYPVTRLKIYVKGFLKMIKLFLIFKQIATIFSKTEGIKDKKSKGIVNDPLFPKNDWDKMKTFLDKSEIS